MTGLVLCGGQSVRMGADKGTKLIDNQTWASLAAEKLKALNIPVKFSVNRTQAIAYGNLFQKENIIIDSQTLSFGGPLKGILSTHLSAPAEDLFVLACDLIKIESRLMSKLIAEMGDNSDFEAYVYGNADFHEPLCGIYKSYGLAQVINLYEEGSLKKHSLQFVLSQLKTYQIPLTATDQSYFENFNSPTELNEL